MKPVMRLGLLALMIGTLAGCGGGGGGGGGGGTPPPPPPVGPVVPVPTGVAPITLSAATPAATFAALQLAVPAVAVTINSPPKVTFSLTDQFGNAVIGFGSKSQSATATLPSTPNLTFSLAKLVPGVDGDPSKWVNYIVTTVPTKNATTGVITDSVPTRPTSDNTGTLVDNGNGTYTYTFYRDITQIKAVVDAMTVSAPNDKAALGDLTYDPALVHRLTIQIYGNAPGTGSNTPNGVTVTPGVPMENPVNVIYDFIPATGLAVTATDPSRDIVATAKCNECHSKIGVTTPHGGRVDTRYCVVCHNDQRKYGRPEATTTATGYSGRAYMIDGVAVGNFPNYVHKIHMGAELLKDGYDYAGVKFNEVEYPQDVRNCTKCHDGSASAANNTPDGDNWKTVPTLLACASCHDGIDFTTGQGTTLAGAATGHIGGSQLNNKTCVLCHDQNGDGTQIVAYHIDKLPTTFDVTKRTMSAAITNVVVDVTPTAATATSTAGSTGTGNVTVTFNLTDAGVAVTDPAAFTGLAITLAKLNPASGASSNWQSYTARGRTTVIANPPVIQGYSEAATAGTLTHTGGGVWTYKFALLNASTPGDIRTIDHVHNASSGSITGVYSAASMPTLPNATFTDTSMTTVSYDWWKTHRVGMEFSKAAAGPIAAINNKFNAIYDFVPLADAARPAETRNIVSKNTCDSSCHGGGKLHKGYTTEYCATCHNQNTFDPATGAVDAITGKVTAATVDLQRIVHKLHMGEDLPSVVAGGTFTINGAGHNYSNVVFPGIIEDCEICHSATAKKANGTTVLENASAWYTNPTSRACGTCHDSLTATAHINLQISAGVDACGTCHGVNATDSVKAVHSR